MDQILYENLYDQVIWQCVALREKEKGLSPFCLFLIPIFPLFPESFESVSGIGYRNLAIEVSAFNVFQFD